jgi:hypothetical protein
MSQNGSAQDDIEYRSKQIEVQAPIAVLYQTSKLWFMAKSVE